MSPTHAAAALPADLARTRVGLAVFVGWWTMLALFFAYQTRFMTGLRGTPRPWDQALLIGALDSYSWALLALAAFFLARRLPLDRTPLLRLVGFHLASALLLVAARLEFFSYIGPRLIPGAHGSITSIERLIYAGPSNLLIYVMLVGVGYTLEYFRRYRDRELHASQLEARLAEAQLQALTTQLQPRFLFSALRTISSLMHRDPRAADRTLALLGDLLRLTLQQGERPEVTLQEEVEIAELYVEIEQARLGDRLHVVWKVEPEALTARVPHLLLQPLVDEVIKNGVAGRLRPGTVSIRAHVVRDRLILEVSLTLEETHTAAGLRARATRRADEADVGGLANTRARLAGLYGDEHRLTVVELGGGARIVTVTLPFLSARQERESEALPAEVPRAAAGVGT